MSENFSLAIQSAEELLPVLQAPITTSGPTPPTPQIRFLKNNFNNSCKPLKRTENKIRAKVFVPS